LIFSACARRAFHSGRLSRGVIGAVVGAVVEAVGVADVMGFSFGSCSKGSACAAIKWREKIDAIFTLRFALGKNCANL